MSIKIIIYYACLRKQSLKSIDPHATYNHGAFFTTKHFR